MSASDTHSQAETLLRQGIEAAKAGNKAIARALLEQVVEQDQRSEKGWFWLAAVTDDIAEKKICLGNVLVVNPDNDRARRLLEQLEGTSLGAGVSGTDAGSGRAASGGVSRAAVYAAIGLGALALIVLVLLLAQVMGGGDDEPSSTPTTPAQAILPQDTPAPGDGSQPTQAIPLATWTAIPSITPTPPRATWTPVPSKTPIPAVPPTVFPAPPAGLAGQIIMRSGTVPGDPNNQPIALIKADGTMQRTITPGTERGHAPALSPDGSLYAFILYAPGTREEVLQINNFQGTAPRTAASYWAGAVALQKQNQPCWSPDGQWLAFVAQDMGSATIDLYRTSLANPNGDPDALERLTNDDAQESWPAYSPDGGWIVYAADLSLMDFGAATELRIIDLTTQEITNLTSNGPELAEAAPDWSPDGAQIVFQAAELGSQQNDIYVIPASGAGPAEKIITSDFDDIQPRYSPNGQFIVFSSNRAGNWDLYVYEIATRAIFQVTTSAQTDIANDWGR